MWIRGVVIVSIELDTGDVLLEKRHRNRPGKLFAPPPNEVQSLAQHRGKGVNVLIPSAVEVAEEQQIIVLEVLLHLAVAQKRKSLARQNHPPCEFDKGKVGQILAQRLHVAEKEKEAAKNPRLPWLHGSDRIHRVH